MDGAMIPRKLEEPARILTLEPAQLTLLLGCVYLGITTRHVIGWIVAGFVLVLLYGKVVGTRRRGFSVHLAYWHLPLRTFQRTPPSWIREFIG